MDITIAASDNPGGIFTISTISPLTLSEDFSSSAVVTIRRDPLAGLLGEVIIDWEVFYTDSGHSVPLSDILTLSSGSVTFLENQINPVDDLILSLQTDRVSRACAG